MSEWELRPIPELQTALRAGRLSARALVEAAIVRHERYGKRLNAYKAWDASGALRQAAAADAAFARGEDLGPLQGIPISVKDLYGVPGFPTFAGSPHRLPPRAEDAGPIVAALMGQQAVVMGKTHTVEFAYGALGTNPHWGAPWNPWDAREHRAPGGSSAGAGVSLIEGSAFVALGTDTGGSVRIPASLTGTVGFKTTKGRWPTDGIVALSTTLDTAGILTRSVADAAVALGAIEARLSGRTARPLDPRPISSLRLAVVKDHFHDGDASVIAVVERAVQDIAKAGARVREIAFPEAREAATSSDLAAVLAVEGYANVAIELPTWLDSLDPNVKRRMEDGRTISAVDYLAALAHMRRLQHAAALRFADIDALLVPTVPVSAPRLVDVATWDTYRKANAAVLANVSLVNRLGLCAITIPAGLDDQGLPVGLQLIAGGGRDVELVEVALAVERVLGTAAARLGVAPLTTG